MPHLTRQRTWIGERGALRVTLFLGQVGLEAMHEGCLKEMGWVWHTYHKRIIRPITARQDCRAAAAPWRTAASFLSYSCDRRLTCCVIDGDGEESGPLRCCVGCVVSLWWTSVLKFEEWKNQT